MNSDLACKNHSWFPVAPLLWFRTASKHLAIFVVAGVFLFLQNEVVAAVAHNAASESHTGTTASTNQASFSWTHTPVGIPRGVLVYVFTYGTSAMTVTGVKYGGVTMTAVAGGAAADTAGEPGRVDTFFLGAAIPAGAQQIVVSRLNNAWTLYAAAATQTAAADTEVTGMVLLQENGTFTEQSVNDGSPGSNSQRYAGAYAGGSNNLAAGPSSAIVNNIDIGSRTFNMARETTAGQGARNVGFAYGTSDDRAAVHLAVREIVTSAVVSINRAGGSPTSAPTVSWTVIFNKSVTGMDDTAFTLVASGLSGAYISSVTGSGTTWTVTANTGIGVGTLGLNQTGPGSVSPTLTGTFTGQVYTISATPALAEYRMDEAGWNGTANEVVDSSGGYPGTAGNAAIPPTASTAFASDPAHTAGAQSTCRYGLFDSTTVPVQTKTYVDLKSTFPKLSSSYTVTAWIRSNDITKTGQRIFVNDDANQGWAISLGDGGAGRLRVFNRSATNSGTPTAGGYDPACGVFCLGTLPGVITNGAWYFVAVTVDTVNKQVSLYAWDSSLAPLVATSTAYNGTWGTDPGATSIGGETSVSGEYPGGFAFVGNIDEVRVYQKVLSSAALAAVAAQTRVCSALTPTPGSLNAFETSTAAGAIAGVIKTKVSGSAFTLDVVAINAGTQLVAFNDNVKVELLGNTTLGVPLDAQNCPSSSTVVQTIASAAITGGRSTVNFAAVANAWRDVRVRISYPAVAPTVTSCSTDNFSIRPSSFTVAVTDANWSTAGTTRTLANTGASGGNVHKAGQPFTITVTPSPGTTTNYDASPGVSALACTLPAVCANGTLSVGAFSGSGTRTSTSATYTEAGAFNLTLVDQNYASVDASDGTPADCSAAGRYVCQSPAPVAVGRFVPDHFAVTAVIQPIFRTFDTTDAACTTPPSGAIRSFTYMGQFFGYQMLPVAMVTSQNASNGTTTNYRGALWKLASGSVSQTIANSPVKSLTTPPATVLSETADSGTGTLTSNFTDKIAFDRDAVTPQPLFTANLSLTWSVADANENSANQGVISTTTALAFNGGGSGIAFDGGGASAGKEFRYGQLAIRNANGSQLVALPIWLFTRYWNGTSFIVNAADNCTALAGANIEMSNFQGTLGPIASCKTRLPAAITFNAGRATVRLTAPGAGVVGSVDLTAHLESTVSGTPQTCTGGTPSSVTGADKAYLQGKWSGPTYNQNPTGRAAFGVYRGTEEIIHIRENY